MPRLFELCTPREVVLTGGIRESEFAADLARVLRKEGPAEYPPSQRTENIFAAS